MVVHEFKNIMMQKQTVASQDWIFLLIFYIPTVVILIIHSKNYYITLVLVEIVVCSDFFPSN